MKIFVSKAYQKWKKTAKDKNMLDVIEKFLTRVFNAHDITQVSPKPKLVGNNLGRGATVPEYSPSKKYRVYARCMEIEPGVTAFYVATVGSKGVTDQNDDIVKAISIFDNVESEEWAVWEPTPEQIQALSMPESEDTDDAADEVPPAAAPEAKPKKKKGKPVDENGLTPAERKALRKKEMEEKQRLQRLAVEKERRATQQAEQAKAQKAETEKVAAPKVAETPAPVVADNTPVVEPVVEVTDVKADVADTVAAPANVPVEPSVTLNGAPMSEPKLIVVDVKFQNVMDVQYELDVIEHQMKIEKLEMEIIQHRIAMAQREIALEQLAIKRLKLLQAQKMQDMQK